MMNKKIHLSIIIPAYNEEANLSSTLKDISVYLKNKDYGYEVIVVDDGSDDQTVNIASGSKALFSSFILIKNGENHGKGYSVKKGVQAAEGEYILFMDADNSTRIDQLDKLMPALNEGYDVALASRRVPGAEVESSQPLHRIVMGNIYIILSRLLLGSTVKDYNCGFKLYKKDAAKLLFSFLTRSDWSFDAELIFLISKFGLKAKEVPVKWVDKRTSKVRPLQDGIKSFLSLIKIKHQDMHRLYD
ncbi:MAG: dolichyl-phosphate beta-glucosyltransferase [Candidatus Omnitrophota bacterium]